MASTSVQRSTRSEVQENVGLGVRSGKSADARAGGAKPVRRALGDVTNQSKASSAHKSTSKKLTTQSKPLHATAPASSSRRRKVAKVDLDNPPELEKMTPFRERVEGTPVDKELLDATKKYRPDLSSFLLGDSLLAPVKDVALPADMDTLFGSSFESRDSGEEERKFQELLEASNAAVQEAASIGTGLDSQDVHLDQLLEELSLF